MYANISTIAGVVSGNYNSFINFVFIERPVLSYGYDTGKYVLKYFGKDPSNMFYSVEYVYKIGTDVYDLSGVVSKPNMFLHSENFGNGIYSGYTSIKTLAPVTTALPAISNNYLVF